MRTGKPVGGTTGGERQKFRSLGAIGEGSDPCIYARGRGAFSVRVFLSIGELLEVSFVVFSETRFLG